MPKKPGIPSDLPEEFRHSLVLRVFGGQRLAWTVLICSLILSVIFWRIGVNEHSQVMHERFVIESQQIQWEIESRLLDSRAALRATTAFFESIDSVSWERWESYSAILKIQKLLPEMQALGFAPRVSPEELATHVSTVRDAMYPSYDIFPTPGDDAVYPVVFIEPFTHENQRMLGFDMFSEPHRRKAMQEARRTGLAASTPGIRLIVDSQSTNIGFSMFRPVYSAQSSNRRARSLESEEDSLIGYAYASFRFSNLMRGILPEHQGHGVRFEIVDADAPNLRLYDSDTALFAASYDVPASLKSHFQVNAGERNWLVRVDASPTFIGGSGFNVPTVFLFNALCVNSLLFLLLLAFTRVKRHAEMLTVRMTDELRLSNAKLKQLDVMKTVFLTTASHELRTPLAIIREFVALIRDRITGDINHEQEECLDSALRNCDRLGSLINGILDLQRLESGKVRLHLRRVELPALLQTTIVDFHVIAEKRGQTIQLNLDRELPAVLCDSDHTVRILVNIIGNAVKFTPEGGTIAVTASTDEKNPGYVSIAVSNTGDGLSPSEMARLFGRFTQLDENPRTEKTGSGLGLAITKELVELQGGHISVTSQLGEKTEFLITLPTYSRDSEIRSFITGAHKRSVDEGLQAALFIVRDLNIAGMEGQQVLDTCTARIRKALRGANDDCHVVSDTRVILATVVTEPTNFGVVEARIRKAILDEFNSAENYEVSSANIQNVEETVQFLITICVQDKHPTESDTLVQVLEQV
jgi:signal transduction histidine kinase